MNAHLRQILPRIDIFFYKRERNHLSSIQDACRICRHKFSWLSAGIERPPGVREAGSIPVGTLSFSYVYARVIMINSPFITELKIHHLVTYSLVAAVESSQLCSDSLNHMYFNGFAVFSWTIHRRPFCKVVSISNAIFHQKYI